MRNRWPRPTGLPTGRATHHRAWTATTAEWPDPPGGLAFHAEGPTAPSFGPGTRKRLPLRGIGTAGRGSVSRLTCPCVRGGVGYRHAVPGRSSRGGQRQLQRALPAQRRQRVRLQQALRPAYPPNGSWAGRRAEPPQRLWARHAGRGQVEHLRDGHRIGCAECSCGACRSRPNTGARAADPRTGGRRRRSRAAAASGRRAAGGIPRCI